MLLPLWNLSVVFEILWLPLYGKSILLRRAVGARIQGRKGTGVLRVTRAAQHARHGASTAASLSELSCKLCLPPCLSS